MSRHEAVENIFSAQLPALQPDLQAIERGFVAVQPTQCSASAEIAESFALFQQDAVSKFNTSYGGDTTSPTIPLLDADKSLEGFNAAIPQSNVTTQKIFDAPSFEQPSGSLKVAAAIHVIDSHTS